VVADRSIRPGLPKHTQVKALSRTYARAIAGTPTAMNFDPETGVFQLTYILNLVPLLLAPPNTQHSFERFASTPV
jgi:hypothetical protein